LHHCFVREEGEGLILCSGIPQRWLDQKAPISFGPAHTKFGSISITITAESEQSICISWQNHWHDVAPEIQVQLPGFTSACVEPDTHSVMLKRGET